MASARAVETEVLANVDHADLTVFVVWSDWGSGTGPEVAAAATEIFSDRRVAQYWDGPNQPSLVLSNALHARTGVETGDVYLGFARGVEWTGEVPSGMAFEVPGFPKTHDGRSRDAGALRARVEALVRDPPVSPGSAQP